jgi:hypothetical protein
MADTTRHEKDTVEAVRHAEVARLRRLQQQRREQLDPPTMASSAGPTLEHGTMMDGIVAGEPEVDLRLAPLSDDVLHGCDSLLLEHSRPKAVSGAVQPNEPQHTNSQQAQPDPESEAASPAQHPIQQYE